MYFDSEFAKLNYGHRYRVTKDVGSIINSTFKAVKEALQNSGD
jgi:hypothetical protein